MAERKATVERNTLETQITATVNLDGSGKTEFDTGVPFLELLRESLEFERMSADEDDQGGPVLQTRVSSPRGPAANRVVRHA